MTRLTVLALLAGLLVSSRAGECLCVPGGPQSVLGARLPGQSSDSRHREGKRLGLGHTAIPAGTVPEGVWDSGPTCPFREWDDGGGWVLL